MDSPNKLQDTYMYLITLQNYFSLEKFLHLVKRRTRRRTQRWIKYASEKKQKKPRHTIKFKRFASATTENGEYRIFSFSKFKIFCHVF